MKIYFKKIALMIGLLMMPVNAETLTLTPNAKKESRITLKKDASIQLIAEAYALDAIDTAKANFNIDLDNTEANIENVWKLRWRSLPKISS